MDHRGGRSHDGGCRNPVRWGATTADRCGAPDHPLAEGPSSMPGVTNRRRGPRAGRGAAPVGRLGLLVLFVIGPAAGVAEEPSWPLGSWRVVEHGLGWG